jgi:RimJ/RimL family protein N-acetyltransferase
MLEGNKVTLRAVEKEDQDTLWRFWNDLEGELAGGGDPPLPISVERLRMRFEREQSEGTRDKTDFIMEADGASIGHCGLYHADLAARHCELGIHIGRKDYWGRGYGREAVNLLLDYAFRIRNLRRVWLETHASNERAIRAYRACGFVEEGRMREHVWIAGRYVDNVIMGVMRGEWQGGGAVGQGNS